MSRFSPALVTPANAACRGRMALKGLLLHPSRSTVGSRRRIGSRNISGQPSTSLTDADISRSSLKCSKLCPDSTMPIANLRSTFTMRLMKCPGSIDGRMGCEDAARHGRTVVGSPCRVHRPEKIAVVSRSWPKHRRRRRKWRQAKIPALKECRSCSCRRWVVPGSAATFSTGPSAISDRIALDVLQLAARIVSAHVSYNQVALGELPLLIEGVYRSLTTAGQAELKPARSPIPAVSVAESVFPNFLTCPELHSTPFTRRVFAR